MNKSEKDHIEESFRFAFGNFEVDPPADSWEQIQAGIRQRKAVLLWKTIGMAASVILLTGTALWFMLRNDSTESPSLPAITENAGRLPEFNIPSIPSDTAGRSRPTIITDKFKLATSHTDMLRNAKPSANDKQTFEEMLSEKSGIPGLALDSVLKTTPLTMVVNQSQPETQEQPVAQPVAFDLADEDPFLPPAMSTPSETWKLAVVYGTIHQVAMSSDELVLSSAKAEFTNNTYTANLSLETRDFSDIENTVHQLPISFGLSLTKDLNTRISVETGLLMTRLGSTSNTFRQNEEWAEYRNYLIYLGIPLNLHYRFNPGQQVGIYFAAGTMVEKGVASGYRTTYFRQDIPTSVITGTIGIQGLQVSLNVFAGAEIRIARQWGIYAQPGINAFLLNKTQPYNIRSARTVWPALQTGIRLSF